MILPNPLEEKMDIRVLVNNAGCLVFDDFVAVPEGRLQALLNLHILTLTSLCRLFAAYWINKTESAGSVRRYILNMSSMSAWMAMPSIQCYNASIAFVLNF